MTKALPKALLAMALIMLALTSCATGSDNARSYTEDECAYTLRLVLEQATDRAIPEMFLAMNELRDSMVMSDYSYLVDLRYTIPGMDRLINEWDLTVTTNVIPYFDLFSSYLDAMAEQIVFPNPIAMVEQSSFSISQFLMESEGPGMATVVRDHLPDLDVKIWRQIAVQYNSWAATRERLYGETGERIDANMSSEDIITLLSQRLVEIYIRYLSSAEIMIRTTPNADMDPVAARVLNLE